MNRRKFLKGLVSGGTALVIGTKVVDKAREDTKGETMAERIDRQANITRAIRTQLWYSRMQKASHRWRKAVASVDLNSLYPKS